MNRCGVCCQRAANGTILTYGPKDDPDYLKICEDCLKHALKAAQTKDYVYEKEICVHNNPKMELVK